MFMKETYVNNTEDYIFGDSGFFEPYTDNLGKLYKSLLKEHGRCIGKVYIGDNKPIGWIFEKKMHYERSDDTYIQHTWVEFAACKLVRQNKYVPLYIDRMLKK